MNRKATCQACINHRHGVKSRIAVPHTCGEAFNICNPPEQRDKKVQVSDTTMLKKGQLPVTKNK